MSGHACLLRTWTRTRTHVRRRVRVRSSLSQIMKINDGVKTFPWGPDDLGLKEDNPQKDVLSLFERLTRTAQTLLS